MVSFEAARKTTAVRQADVRYSSPIRFAVALRIGAIVAAALLPVLGVVAFNEVSLRATRATEVRANALWSAQQTALELERFKAGAQNLLETISSSPAVVEQRWERCQQFLSRLIKRVPQYVSLSVIGEDGTPRCRSDGARPPLNLTDRPYFQEAMADPQKVIMADYTVSWVSGKATLPISFGFGEGDKRAVIVAALSLDWLQETIADRQVPANGSITIADRGGTIIARHPYPERFIGTRIPDQLHSLLFSAEPGAIEVMSQDGTARYLGYVPVSAPPIGLYISVGISKDEAFAEMNRGTLRALLIPGVAVMAAGVLTYGLSQGLVRGPIERINQTIAARREGDLNVRNGLAAGRGEIEDLGRAVDTYMDELNEARAVQDVADKHCLLLTQEMAHRLKNVLATVQAVAQQTFQQGRASGELKVFAARLQSIAAAQQLLLVDDIGHLDPEAVIRTAVAPFDDGNGRITISGPRIKIQSRANLAIVLAFHELSTNAVKYGSLAYGDGNVDIHWTVVANGLRLVWSERGGPLVVSPSRRGFGSQMIE